MARFPGPCGGGGVVVDIGDGEGDALRDNLLSLYRTRKLTPTSGISATVPSPTVVRSAP